MFDLGGVVVEWNPRRLLSDECIDEIDFFTWNIELDRGAPFPAAIASLRAAFPRWRDEIDAFDTRWPETIGPPIPETIAVIDKLRAAGVGCYVLSNSSAETVPRSDLWSDLAARFDGVLLSGEVGLLKPDAAIYRCAEKRFGLIPSETWFIDDNQPNVDSAIACGWNGIHFTGPDDLVPLADL